ncbi:Vacuolar amino acid transporter 3 [Zancudomyces culisetae]|uniref:Vacuolar amino acid transporter 3 n=1 Tax=Zancudomyces culisetae TaxID=1213189 RepID=A0A1R1PZA6_ZANCU|nr:Vacuolar amino acid transporter 3 [Zancudomyces culisetae]|eukprot:OMH86269.1 Vacuolar amino acid transporter 3 [Zancudomyces culisetae]
MNLENPNDGKNDDPTDSKRTEIPIKSQRLPANATTSAVAASNGAGSQPRNSYLLHATENLTRTPLEQVEIMSSSYRSTNDGLFGIHGNVHSNGDSMLSTSLGSNAGDLIKKNGRNIPPSSPHLEGRQDILASSPNFSGFNRTGLGLLVRKEGSQSPMLGNGSDFESDARQQDGRLGIKGRDIFRDEDIASSYNSSKQMEAFRVMKRHLITTKNETSGGGTENKSKKEEEEKEKDEGQDIQGPGKVEEAEQMSVKCLDEERAGKEGENEEKEREKRGGVQRKKGVGRGYEKGVRSDTPGKRKTKVVFSDVHQLNETTDDGNVSDNESHSNNEADNNGLGRGKSGKKRENKTVRILRRSEDADSKDEDEDIGHYHTMDKSGKRKEPREKLVNPLKLQSGHITHSIYKWTEEMTGESSKEGRIKRTKSYVIQRNRKTANEADPEWEIPFDASEINRPGGFRRHYVVRQALSEGRQLPALMTGNFVDFISLFGHFAGETYPSDEDDEEQDQESGDEEEAMLRRRYSAYKGQYDQTNVSETSTLLRRGGQKNSVQVSAAAGAEHKASSKKAFFLLIKGFVGTLLTNGVANVRLFNPDTFPLLIGTAVFSFEGIGLVIPVADSMKHPQDFPKVLKITVIVSAFLFASIAALSYMAFGDATETVIFLNMKDGGFTTNSIQLLYSIAILFSVPLQFFPAIRIMEAALFTRSGKRNSYVKWQKNIFRLLLCIFTNFISVLGADHLDQFVSMIGSFACVPLSFIYPSLLHYLAFKSSSSQLVKVKDIALCVFGIATMVYVTQLGLRQWGTHEPSPPQCG